MADNKSCEGMVTYKCMSCYAEMSVSKRRELRMDGMNCFLCKGPIQQVENKRSIGSLSVDIDCSDALKGLKAVQREAKKATAALKEFEEQQKRLSKIKGYNPHTVVFDETQTMCPNCGSSNIGVRRAVSSSKCICTDCGYEI